MGDVSEDDRLAVKSLGCGMNLTELRRVLPELEAAFNRKAEASEDFSDVVKVASINTGIMTGVLSQFVAARCNDTVKKKSRSAEQLSLLFVEVGA